MNQPTKPRLIWRRVPVFLASAFHDMGQERDLVVGRVIPQVNQRLSELGLGCEAYPVDLRWGATTDQSLSPEARLRAIIETCLEEVSRCQPFVLGFIAESLGPRVDDRLVEPLLAAHGMAAPGVPLSVTCLEILFAISVTGSPDAKMPLVMRRQRANTQPAPNVEVFVAHLAACGVSTLPYTDEASGLGRLEHLLVE